MKKTTLIISLLTLALFSQAQKVDSWKVMLNNKLLINTSKVDEVKNVKTLNASDIKKSGFLEIKYKESTDDWYRSFFFTDESGIEIYRRDSTTSVKIRISALLPLSKAKKEIKIYTTISPRDPSVAVRVRPVHIYTLRFR